MDTTNRKKDIAVIGLSGVFPKSKNLDRFWENLVNGRELIHFYEPDELDPQLSAVPGFVPAQSYLSEAGSFDYRFFGYTREEAMIMDPQVRIMHEQVYAALDNAGYGAQLAERSIGLYLSASDNLNWRLLELLNANPKVPKFIAQKYSNKEFISTLISYKLGLTGPSLFLDSACSSSLSNVHLAGRALLLKECNLAVAGGVCIHSTETKGYVHEQGLIFSEDGHCRAFDEKASGTVDGEGAGAVVLKRYADAVRDKDYIYAVIRGTALNNDGKRKVGYTAPSVKGQSDCIKMAMKVAGVQPEQVGYIEAHGTGTRLGDPIEIEALNDAFNYNTQHRCAVGAIKTNIGHLDAAAGIAGFIKTCLVLDTRQLPPSLNYERANPEINFDKGPFYVNARLQEWPAEKQLIAGVSSFGIGGTNCHVVLEEHRAAAPAPTVGSPQLLCFAAKTGTALEAYRQKLADFLLIRPELRLDQLSYSLQKNAKAFPFREAIVARDVAEAVQQLRTPGQTMPIVQGRPQVVFLFPGQGTQYFKMGYALYQALPFFRNILDEGFEVLRGLSGENFKAVLGYDEQAPAEETEIHNTRYTQPLLFMIEYALARTLMACGLQPAALIGHSLGEYVAACIAGVFSYVDGLKIIFTRSSLMQALPAGSMLAVKADEARITPLIEGALSTAAINVPNTVVLSGEQAFVEALAAKLEGLDIPHTILQTSHAFHSYMMDAMLEPFEQALQPVPFKAPEIPLVSNLTGDFMSQQDLTAAYWRRHLRETVQFSKGLQKLVEKWPAEGNIFVEVGPGRVLLNFLKAIAPRLPLKIAPMRSAREEKNDYQHLLQSLGTLWKIGQPLQWEMLYDEKLEKVPVPSYAFDETHLPARVDPLKLLQPNLEQGMDLSALIGQTAALPIFEPEVENGSAGAQAAQSYRIGLSTTFVAPEGPIQERVTAIWQSYLGQQQLGVEDDFFELGGDSLKAMSILNAVNQEFDCEIPIQDLYGNPTIVNMSAKIELSEKLKKVTQKVEHKNKLKI